MSKVPFGSNAVRVSPRSWAVTLLLVWAVVHFTPILWETAEPLDLKPDYRIPFSLAEDYWLFHRSSRLASERYETLVVGDSVVWGHYVAAEETLSHYLNELASEERFANLGVDGIHPAAMAGLIDHYGRGISGKNVILHCNLLWISSKRHDLQIEKEFAFNHPALVPQFFAHIPCYRESISARLGIVIGRREPFCGWARHMRMAYFGNADLPRWTIDHPHENPLAAVGRKLPSPNELPSPPPDARPWTEQGIPRLAARWVELDTSFQWRSFQRTVRRLRHRGNRVFVLVGPLNEPMLTEASLATYRRRKQQVAAWLREHRIAHLVASALPSEQYADASHPLSDGYAAIAAELFEAESFVRFESAEPPR